MNVLLPRLPLPKTDTVTVIVRMITTKVDKIGETAPMTFERFRADATETLRLGGPLIAAQLAQISMGFVDAVMAGRLSAKDLAAVAVGANVFWPIGYAFATVGIAISPTVSHLYGAGKRSMVGHSVRQGLWLALILSIGAFAALRSTTPLLRM